MTEQWRPHSSTQSKTNLETQDNEYDPMGELPELNSYSDTCEASEDEEEIYDIMTNKNQHYGYADSCFTCHKARCEHHARNIND